MDSRDLILFSFYLIAHTHKRIFAQIYTFNKCNCQNLTFDNYKFTYISGGRNFF